MTIFASASAEHQKSHAAALRDGLAVHGIRATIARTSTTARTRYVACWGWRYGRLLRQRGHEVLVIERGYIGDRFRWTSLGWNGLNGRATFRPKDDATRFYEHFTGLMRPWKEGGGEYVLLIGQVPGDASLGGMNLGRWYQDTANAAGRAYDLPVRFRPHPMAVKRGIREQVRGCAVSKRELAADLAEAAAVISFNSNTTVESVLAGVPTVALDKGSMAYEMCGRQIGAIWKPDRSQWATRLAWCQWSMDEIKSGVAWETVRPQ